MPASVMPAVVMVVVVIVEFLPVLTAVGKKVLPLSLPVISVVSFIQTRLKIVVTFGNTGPSVGNLSLSILNLSFQIATGCGTTES